MDCTTGCRRAALWCVLGFSGLFVLAVGCTPTVWIEGQDRFSVDGADVANLSIKSHNGRIVVHGDSDPAQEVVVEVFKRAGGTTLADAEACMNAIQIIEENRGDTQVLGWRYDGIKKPGWNANVAFEVSAPSHLDLEAETHNGRLTVRNMEGECRLETHNGTVDVEALSRRVMAETHNGGVRVVAPANEVQAVSHNGRMSLRLDPVGDLSGTVLTHNGSIDLTLGENTRATIDCSTHNGRIRCNRSLDHATVTRSHVRGSIGESDAILSVETHNGSIRVD